MKSIKICYTIRDNLGDAINPYIIHDIFHMDPICTRRYHCDMTGIGSGLRRFFIPKESFSMKYQIRKNISNKPLQIWSAGFINTPNGDEQPIRDNIHVHSVRGELSKKYLEQILNKPLPECTTGDAGLLASELISGYPIQKKYKLGIIPHDKERDEIAYQNMLKQIPGSVIIDVRGDVIDELCLIASCEAIVSSSLHGLIIADSFLIPNRQAVLTDKLSGDGFKFWDYYSSWGMESDPIRLDKGERVDIDQIISDYKITGEMLEQKQKDIKEAFYKCVRSTK